MGDWVTDYNTVPSSDWLEMRGGVVSGMIHLESSGALYGGRPR
jgi:hypothetical protein